MATVTAFTAERMAAVEAACIVSGGVVVNNLILTKHDGSTVDAGNVRGPQGIQGPIGEVSLTELGLHVPIGLIADYIGVSVPPPKWLGMIGQTVINAQTTYPAWWALIPASMKSGANAIMPDTRGKVNVGYSTADTDFDQIASIRGSVGTGGTKTHQLTQAELPVATITIDPPALSIDPPSTTISVDPPDTTVTIIDPGHVHSLLEGEGFTGSGANAARTNGSGGDLVGGVIAGAFTGISAHVNIAAFSATVDIAPFNVDAVSFQSGTLGSGVAHSIVQPYVVFMKIVKVL